MILSCSSLAPIFSWLYHPRWLFAWASCNLDLRVREHEKNDQNSYVQEMRGRES
jgi:hypothetical protein